jgi:multidrug efflux pump subunit AcrB
MYYLNRRNGVQYSVVVQDPQYAVSGKSDISNIPISSSTAGQSQWGLLTDVATIQRTVEPESINHYNIRRVVDIYGAIQDRDLGAVGKDVNRIINAHRKELPRGSFITLRGQFGTMRNSYIGLIGGLVFAIALVYLLIVVNFQPWLDPLSSSRPCQRRSPASSRFCL